MSIKFENTEVMNFEGAIRGMRNPLNSWCLSDSHWVKIKDASTNELLGVDFIIGENDLNLMKRLINAGNDHRKFMRQILVSVDIIAPLYWWKEFDTYKVGTVANSCSTMHKIHENELSLDDFSCEKLGEIETSMMESLIEVLNDNREAFLETNEKYYWEQMIQLLPSSYNQKRTVTLNYEVLRNIAHSRQNHKLDEWSIDFMKWIDSLPYANDLLRS